MLARRLAAYAASVAFIPAPPVVHTVYGAIDPNVNRDGQMVGAYADPATQTIYLPKDPSAYMRAHETGHLFDSQILSDGDRRYFARLMHAPAGPWDHGQAYGRVDGNVSPNEWFSDYYAAAATRMTPDRGYSVGQYAEIDAKRMRAFQKAMARLARRRDLEPYKS